MTQKTENINMRPTNTIKEALRHQDLLSLVVKEEEPEIVIELKKIGFKFDHEVKLGDISPI